MCLFLSTLELESLCLIKSWATFEILSVMKSQIPVLFELSSLKDERNSWEWQCGADLCSLFRDNLTDFIACQGQLEAGGSHLCFESSLLRLCHSAWSIMSPQRVLIGCLVSLLIGWLIGEDWKRAYRPVLSLLWFLLGPKHTRGCWKMHQLVWFCRFLQW